MATSSVQVIDHPNGKIVQVRGVIDGSFELGPLIGEHEIVLFDLDGVTRITSFGVREWRTGLNQLDASYVCFVGCRPSLVSQFNLVPGFACGGELISFYLPYICPECNHVAETLLDLRVDDRSLESLEPPGVTCPRCSAAMEFDDIPSAYFKYARSVARPRPPAAANQMIDERAPEAARRELAVRKDVEDTVTAFWLSGSFDNKRALRRLTEGLEGHVVLELSDLDDLNDDGLEGLTSFLREVGEVYLCRVPEAVLGAIVDRLASAELASVRLVSARATLTCAGCDAPVAIELTAARLANLLDESLPTAETCPRCSHALDRASVPLRVLEPLERLPLADAPEDVAIYLRNRAALKSGAGSPSYTAPSNLLFGNYRILRRLGEGGMGEVLLARYVGVEKFEKLVVLKRISREYVRNPGAMQEFQREARVTARLSHPNIVQIFDFSKFDDEYFFAMEYVNGIDLRKALQLCRDAGLHWPANLVMRVISDVCAGLEAAHEYTNEEGLKVPIYHRDVSPENIIISVDGAVKLTDFGIAKTADSSVNTDSGVFKGKHAYSAPEQLEAGDSADHRTDIYATGIVMFETLALRRYLGDEPTMSMAYAASKQPTPKLASERGAIPDGLQDIFERATAANPTERYQTALELRESLESLLKRDEYASNHDLAIWIRKVMALDRGASDSPQHTPGFRTADTRPSRGEETASERALTAKARTLRTTKKPKASDGDG